jgi:hypothetical protein
MCGEASACYLSTAIEEQSYHHPPTHTFRLAHMPVKRYLSRYPAMVAASLIVHHSISLVGCRSVHACMHGG